MENRTQALLTWALVAAYSTVIFSLSSMSQPLPAPVQFYIPDWLGHVCEYAVLGFLLIRALSLTIGSRSLTWILAMTLLLGALYALSDEWHQSFVPMRQSSAHDVLADVIGTFMGAWLWIRVSNFFEKGRKTHA